MGVEVEVKRMKLFNEEQGRRGSVKKVHVGRSPVLSASRPPSRDVRGIPDPVVCFNYVHFS